MRLITGVGTSWRSWDMYGRAGEGGEYEYVASGYGPGVRRPQFAKAGGLLFYLDNAGHLWKYDGTNYYEIGLEEESYWQNWRPQTLTGVINVRTTKTYRQSARAALIDSGGSPVAPVRDPGSGDITVSLDNYVPNGSFPSPTETYPVNSDQVILWVWGFPFVVVGSSWDGGPAGYAAWVGGDLAQVITLTLVPMSDDGDSETEWQSYAWEDFYGSDDRAGFVYPSPITAEYPCGVTMTAGDQAGARQAFDCSDWSTLEDVGGEKHRGKLDGSYQYVFTLTTKHGYESNACQEISVKAHQQIVAIGINQVRIDLSGTCVGLERGNRIKYTSDYIRNINIYRTMAGRPGVYYHLVTIPFSNRLGMGQSQGGVWVTYDWLHFDNSEDIYLGDQLHPLKLTPHQGSSITSTKNCLIVSDGVGVYISDVGDPETFYQYVTFDGAVVAVAAVPHFDNFLVFMQDKIYTVNIFDYSTTLVAHGVGIAGRDAVCIMNDRIIFQSSGGQIYHFAGNTVEPIPGHEKIDELLLGRSLKRNINTQQFDSTFAFYSQQRQECWMVIGQDGAFGNLVLVIKQNMQAFTLYLFDLNVSVTSAVCFQDGGNESILLGMDDGTVWSFNKGAKSDNYSEIEFYLESGEIGLLDEQVRMRRLYTDVIAPSSINIEAQGNYDNEGYVDEGDLQHIPTRSGDERFLNLYGDKVVRCYQFKLSESSLEKFTLKAFSILYQPKLERQRWNR